MFDWEEGDRFSFEDSDRFEEDSLCSWISEPESLCNNWRGWKRQNGGNNNGERPSGSSSSGGGGGLNHDRGREDGFLSLVELAAREVAHHIPFEVVEHVYPPVPEQLQLRIAFWSFPENEEDIRLYSCLANGSADEFQKGEHLFRVRAVKDPLQIGFHLSATVIPPQTIALAKGSYNVAITFDRRRITSCNCTCSSAASWCAHVVSVCLHRIHLPNQVCLRAPVSESLSRLHRDQLQKFAQYLISELPQQILPTAQRLLDELLSCQQTAINTVCGAPDPTAGASASEQTTWCLDEATLHENIRKILIKFCVPSPIVFSDVNYLSSTAPPAAAEWSSLLRPLRGREPEGMWNLLSIVREMFRRNDRNAVPLLEVLTEECLSCEQILVWWFYTKVSLHNGNTGHGGRNNINSNSHPSKHACSSLCDEIVVLWRLAALNPALSPPERVMLCFQMKEWHLRTIEKVCKTRAGGVGGGGGNNVRKSDIEVFPGFKPAIEACLIDWSDYPIPGIAYNESSASKYYFPYTTLRAQESHIREVNASPAVLNCEHPPQPSKRCRSVDFSHDRRPNFPTSLLREVRIVPTGVVGNGPNAMAAATAAAVAAVVAAVNSSSLGKPNESNRSSVSSEGFCENDGGELTNNSRDSDSVDEPEVNAGLSPPFVTSKRDETTLSATVTEILSPASHDCNAKAQGNARSGILPLLASTPSSSKTRKNSDASNFTDKEKLSPDDMDLDSDWSSAPESAQKRPSRPAPNERRDLPPKFEHSESQQSSDDYQVYCYNLKSKTSGTDRPKDKKLTDENNIFSGIKKVEDPLEILFARAEALHAHGHTREACKLGVKLAEELLAHPPNLMIELPPPPTKGKRKKKVNPASHQISCLASATLAKAAFLCTVLAENAEHYHLAFKVGMFGLELARPPASTKALEVKLANQESELVTLLKRIPLGPSELRVIRERAEQLRCGALCSRGDALLPLNLASFIFDALCLLGNSSRNSNAVSNRVPSDELLGFEAAVAALGLKANVSEAEHPLLCEGTRRQRGDLTITLLVHYKDDQEKLAKIMDKLLDKDIHQMYKAPNLSSYYASKAAPNQGMAAKLPPQPPLAKKDGQQPGDAAEVPPCSANSPPLNTNRVSPTTGTPEEGPIAQLEQVVSRINLNGNSVPLQHPCGGARSKEPIRYSNRSLDDHRDDTSSPTWEEDYKAWEAKFRCTNFRTHKKHSAGMASIDSSAPETTSSDNSPTLIRRTGWGKPTGPGSDSGSSGKSSDSFGSSSSGDKNARPKARENESPPLNFATKFGQAFTAENISRNITTTMKNSRFKNKRIDPTIPNQPSEASAHFMFELAKTVLTKAGGNSSTSLFTQPSATQNQRGPHRALHMCAFQIGLYALGLHNCVSPNWLSRTYSSHVSWITSQATEIGSAAISFLIDTWEGHLTPPEVASLADRASRGRDPNLVRAAAELALSCLPHAHALNPNEIQRAILQCKEQSSSMLERACLSVEGAAKGGGVYPEVLFDVARRWYELYSEGLAPEPVVTGIPPVSVSAVTGSSSSSSSIASTIANASSSPPLSVASDPLELETGLLPPQEQPVFSQEGLPLLPQMHCPLPMTPYSIPTSLHVPYPAPPPYNYMPAFGQPCSHLSIHPLHPAAAAAAAAAAYVGPPFPYAGQTTFSMPAQAYYAHPTITTTAPPHLRPAHGPPPPPTTIYTTQMITVPNTQPRPAVIPTTQPLPVVGPPLGNPPPQQAQVGLKNIVWTLPSFVRGQVSSINQTQLSYLLSAYRVGMLALETLARRVHDDRPNAKYARNPPYGEDVKWLLGIAKKLGSSYVQQFCLCTVSSVLSPFLLQEITLEAAQYLARNNPAHVLQHLRSPVLTPLVQKCQQMFIQCTHVKMYHLTAAEYDEFVSIIRTARTAFQMTPGGMVQFNEFLQALRRSKTCKKELWQRIASALQTTAI